MKIATTGATSSKLNRKLAEWAGLVVCPTLDGRPWPPDFTASLDDCFRWLVPKVRVIHGCGRNTQVKIVSGWGDTVGEYGVEVTEMGKRLSLAFDENPALALCRAIEKLVGGQK